MASIGSLVVDLRANTARFNADLAKGSQSLNSFERKSNKAMRSLERGSKQAINSVGALVRSTLGLNTALGAGGLAAGLGLAINQSIKFGDEIGKASKTAGISAEALQEYRFAAELTGNSQKQLDDALGRFNRRLGEGRNGNVAYAKTFNALGVAMSDTNENALEKTFSALASIDDQSRRTSIATKVFGDDARRMALLVQDGAGALDDMRQQARDLGLVLSNENVAAAEAVNDRMTILSNTLKVKFTAAVLENVDAIGQGVDAIAGMITAVGNLNQQFSRFFQNTDGANIDTLRKIRADLVVERDEIQTLLDEPFNFGAKIKAVGTYTLNNEFAPVTRQGFQADIDRRTQEIAAIDAQIAQRQQQESRFAAITAARDLPPASFDFDALGGGSVTTKSDPYADGLKSLNEQIALNQLLANNLNATAGALEAVKVKQDILNRAKEEGRAITVEESAELDRLTQSLAAGIDERERIAKAQERMNSVQQAGAQLYQEMRTPLEQLNESLADYLDMLRVGAIDQETFNRAVGRAEEAYGAVNASQDTYNQRLADGLTGAILYARDLNGLLQGIIGALQDFVSQELLAPQISNFLSGAFASTGLGNAAAGTFGAASGAVNQAGNVAASEAAAAATKALAQGAEIAAGSVTQLATDTLSGAAASVTEAAVTGTVNAAKTTEATATGIASTALTGLAGAAATATVALNAVAASGTGDAVSKLGSAVIGSLPLPGFASGGSFEVAGRAGVDRNLVAFRATAGERVSVMTPGQQRMAREAEGERGGGVTNVVNLTVNAKDAASIKASRGQIEMQMAAALQAAGRRL